MNSTTSRSPTPFPERLHVATVNMLELFLILSLGLFIGLGIVFLPATLRLLWSAFLQPLV